ncbi:multiple C2 and transmembrane domain-containing protein isoform X6 [Cherax quadricarinatus]|uniref:multiple C2 and transmembrane domain-containing protein isoform X6 n=1 Tax=Cherax quadricarinatus TaxID=27406 RepID=UPI002379EAA8|nr:multiple C2 and transmembrane domain-containing protein-like isoform X2 [Cherax quadricarinatus]
MSEGARVESSSDSLKHDTLHVSASEPRLDSLQVTVTQPLNCLKKNSPNLECLSGSPRSHTKKAAVGISLARAFRKVFRSRTPSPSTDERDEYANSESEEIKFEVSSDSECQDGLQVYKSLPDTENGIEDTELTTLCKLNNNSVISREDKCNSNKKDFLFAHNPGLGKSQTYSALSEALQHAFLEGMVCSGAEDISLFSTEDLYSQGSKSDNDTGFSRSTESSLIEKDGKSTNCMLSELRETLKKNLETPLHTHSLLVPTLSNRPRTNSEPSDAGTDDDSSSQHSQEEKNEFHCLLEVEHKNLFGNLFSSRRSSLAPPTDDSKTEETTLHPSPKLKAKDVLATPEGKGHKKLGDRLSKVAEYLQRGGSRLAEQQRRLKSQIWSSVVTIVLVEGKNLLPMDPDGTSDPYVKFRLGNEKYKSKIELHTLSPKWLEQFDFHLFEDQSQILEITVWDKDVRSKDDFMGKCSVDISQYEREITHHIWVDLDKGAGSLFLLLTISGTTSSETISDLHSYQENPKELENISNKYKLSRTLHNLKDIGHLRVKIFKAQGLAAADIGGKSDPFCVLELINARLQTQTEYKTLSPTWNKIFSFNVKDIHSILEVTVYDEDRDHKVEFLGKVAIPLLKIKNGEKKWYALKDKKLRARAKGNNPEILLECSVEWNPIRAAIRTFTPKEEKYMQMEQKFKRQVFITNVNRLKACIMDVYEMGMFVKSCFEWEYPVRSTIAFIVFMVGTYCFEPYMIPIILLILYLRNYIILSIVGTMMHREEDNDYSADEDEADDDDKDKEEKKTLKERLQVIQEVTATVQNAIGFIASICESCKNTFNFSVPFLSWLLILVLLVGIVILYYIPIRYLVMLWGVNKFSRKLIRPHSVINNEILDFLSRVPDDEILRDCRELRPVPQSHDEKRREHRKKKMN